MNPTWASPVLATEVKTAVTEVSELLTRKGIRHALIGGVVLGAYRCEREKRFLARVAGAPVSLQDDITELQAAAGAPSYR